MLHACGEGTDRIHSYKQRYIDLPAFFKAEIDRLNIEHSSVQKTVSIGGEEEQKEVSIADWTRELSAFTAIDLNKPAYQGHIVKDSLDYKVIYRINNPEIDISEVSVTYDEQGDPVGVEIERHIRNFLYQTEERLSYLRGERYTISKQQDVWVLGSSSYYIEGLFE